MKKTILQLCSLLLSIGIYAQPSSFSLVKTISGDIVDFAIDNLSNIYILNSHNQLKKLNANGDSVAVYNDVKRFGKTTLIDVSNPLKVLLYYENFGTIVILDRLLNMINTLDLRKQNIYQAKAIGQSYDNNIWVYDELESKLKKIDESGKLLQETADFRQLFDNPPSPQKIFDQDKYVYLYDSAQSVFVFDYLGALRSRIPIIGWKNVKIDGNYIVGEKNDTLHRFDMNRLLFSTLATPVDIAQCQSFYFNGNRFYCYKANQLEIYTLP